MINNTIMLHEERDDVTLTTYMLDDSPDLMNGKKRPAILICPGGACLFCSDREAEPVALRFAAMGYHAFVLRYSTSAELLEVVSPALHVSENTPPTFLWSTATDELIPVENTIRMATALARASIPFEIHIFEEGPHGLSLADQSTASSLLQIDRDAEKWVDLVEDWLQKRFALPLPPAPPD